MIKVCNCCSRINSEDLKKQFPNEEIIEGCIDVCVRYDDQCFGVINGKLVYTNTVEEFIDFIKNSQK